jgi:hypothetical protein
MKKAEMNVTCRTYGGNEKCVRSFSKKSLREKNYLGYLSLDVRKI